MKKLTLTERWHKKLTTLAGKMAVITKALAKDTDAPRRRKQLLKAARDFEEISKRKLSA